MNLQPVFLKLDGRPGLLVGAGNVALEKLNTLLTSGVRLRVIAPDRPGVAVAGDSSGGWSRIRTPEMTPAEAVAVCQESRCAPMKTRRRWM